jgi:putative mRNA 3-end processing factor
MSSPEFTSWLRLEAEGLFCEPGGFFVDPIHPVARAIVTHGHSDHARPGHHAVLATTETLEIMRLRMGQGAGSSHQSLAYGETITLGDVTVRLEPSGHILGSAQVVIEHQGRRAVISGDYKRGADPTCEGFEVVPCELFITEATFGLPVFKHPPPEVEIAKLLASLAMFPERTHQIGVYGLGKCQRVISLLRQQGYNRPIWMHGALQTMTEFYASRGVALGEVRSVLDATDRLPGELVLCPPSALGDRWSRRTFGVWTDDGGTRALIPVGKAYSGFTDTELVQLDKFVRNNTVEQFGPVRSVAPQVVLEVAFDAINPSKRHKSGLAMRFPRIARIRWDKPAAEADTLEALRRQAI